MEDRASVGYLRYVSSNGDVRDIPPREKTTSKRTVIDVEVEKQVGVVSGQFTAGHCKTMAEAAHTVSSVVDSSSVFANPAFYFPAIKNEMVEEECHET